MADAVFGIQVIVEAQVLLNMADAEFGIQVIAEAQVFHKSKDHSLQLDSQDQTKKAILPWLWMCTEVLSTTIF